LKDADTLVAWVEGINMTCGCWKDADQLM